MHSICVCVRVCTSDENEQVWIWKYEENEVYYENGQDIQVRVMHIEYAPNVRHVVGRLSAVGGGVSGERVAYLELFFFFFLSCLAIRSSFRAPQRTVVTKPGDLIDAGAAKMFADLIPPMRVYATVNDSGLGLTRWWSDGGGDDDAGGDGDGDGESSARDDEELQDVADGGTWKADEAADAQPDEVAHDEGAWERQEDEADDDELVAEARGGGGGDDDALGDE